MGLGEVEFFQKLTNVSVPAATAHGLPLLEVIHVDIDGKFAGHVVAVMPPRFARGLF